MTTGRAQLLLVDLALIFALAWLFGRISVRVRQPPVVGEIVAGITLGPTLFHGAIARNMFPTDLRTVLAGMADVGVILFMFCVGMDLDVGALRGRGSTVLRAAAGSTLIPFALGLAVAPYLLHGHLTSHHRASVVFLGLAMSATAFPVLARILTDRALAATMLGSIAIATAATVDLLAWTGLAATEALGSSAGQHWRVALMLPFAALMIWGVRPLLGRIMSAGGDRSPHVFVVVLIGALLSGAATEAMGLQFIFGAFLFGAVTPRRGAEAVRKALDERAGQVAAVLLPVYFVVAGLKVDLSGLTGADLARFAVILAVAASGKLGGTYLGARAGGLPPRPATGLAVLMDTRGLTELVILSAGLQLGLLDGTLYSLMVAMAVVTTVLTGPLLSLVYAKPVEVPSAVRSRELAPSATN